MGEAPDNIFCAEHAFKHGIAAEDIEYEHPCGTLIYHAMTPPTNSMLKELGLDKRSNYEDTQ